MKDCFKCKLKLKGKSGDYSVDCGNFSQTSIKVHSYGFHGAASFVVDKDDEIDFFYEPDIIEVTVTIESAYAEDDTQPLELKGIITNKSLFNEAVDGYDPDKVQKRECAIEFCDPAAAIWSEHFPVEIFTDKSLEDVIDSYISEPISIKYNAPSMKEKHPLIALGLGDTRNTVSFYDFLMWHLKEDGSIWEYNYKDKQYVIRAEKDVAEEPINLTYDTGKVSVFWPKPPRRSMRVVNSYADDPVNKEVKLEQVYDAVSRDILHTTPIEAEVEKKALEVKMKSNTHEHQLEINFHNFPEVDFYPGKMYEFKAPEWSKGYFFKEKTYRLHTLVLSMNATLDPFTKAPEEEQKYRGSMVGVFELKEEVYVQRPEIQVPLYPFPLEGKIFSDVGEEKELTFNVGQDEKTAQYFYTVQIPWADNQKVTAPFEPTYTNGQTYNPLLKGQRVVVGFSLFTAKIVEVKDWFGSVQMPHKTQGNRTVFAPRNEDKAYTIMEHIKEDDGTLTYFIERKSDKQIQLIRIKEDGLHVIVHKDGEEDPQCHMWMDNNHTIRITSQDKGSKQTQNITLKPEEISILCESGGDKSTIVQTPKSISMDCEEFNLTTKRTNLESKDATVCLGKKLDFSGKHGVIIKDNSKIGIVCSNVAVGA